MQYEKEPPPCPLSDFITTGDDKDKDKENNLFCFILFKLKLIESNYLLRELP